MIDETHKSRIQVARRTRGDATTILTLDTDRWELAKRCAPAFIEAALHRAPTPGAELRMAIISPYAVVVRDLRCAADDFAVIGRHGAVVMGGREALAMSLRHILAIPERIDSNPSLRLIPLSPEHPVVRVDELLPAELRARGDTFQVGEGLLFVAALGPIRPGRLTGLAGSSARVENACARIDARSEPAPEGSGRPRLRLLPRCGHRATSAASSRARLQGPSAPEVHRHGRARPRLVPPGGGRVTSAASVAGLTLEVTSAEVRVSFDLREPWLERGILLGRSDRKCSHRALRLALSSEYISRAHVLLRRERDDLVFYDLASTNGTFVKGARVRRVCMHVPARPDASGRSHTEPVRIVLGSENASVRIVRHGECP
jgi:hypothetical protein